MPGGVRDYSTVAGAGGQALSAEDLHRKGTSALDQEFKRRLVFLSAIAMKVVHDSRGSINDKHILDPLVEVKPGPRDKILRLVSGADHLDDCLWRLMNKAFLIRGPGAEDGDVGTLHHAVLRQFKPQPDLVGLGEQRPKLGFFDRR
jgi:hypothetical protein